MKYVRNMAFIFIFSFFLFQIRGLAIELNVKDYITESDQDASIGINKALDAANEGDTILIPEGEYVISSRIVIRKSNLTITGEDKSKTIIKCNDGTNNNWGVFLIQTSSTVTNNLKNITIENLTIDGNRLNRNTPDLGQNQLETHYGSGTGISILRSNENYEVGNILISNVKIENAPGPAIQINGKRITHDVQVGDYDDVDRRSTDERYHVDGVTVTDCELSNSKIGISQNTTKNDKILNNKIENSLHENITIDLSDDCICEGNNLGVFNGGCGSIGIDNSFNSIIRGNKINNTGSNAGELFNSGITVNSKAGISKNLIIEDNFIENANYGIFLKDHRGYVREEFKLSDRVEEYDYGSRPGEDFYILNNTIKNSVIYGIRVDELTGMAYIINNNIMSEQTSYNDYKNIYVNEYNYKKRNNETESINNVIIGMIKELKVNKLPDKLKYNQGENLDLTNGVFDVILEDDDVISFNMNERFVHVSGFDRNNIDEQIIKLTFANSHLSLKINESDKEVIDNSNESVDRKDEVEVPQTSKNKKFIVIIFGIVLIIAAVIILQKSNKRDNN